MAYSARAREDARELADLIDQLGAVIAARYGAAELTMIERIARLAGQEFDTPSETAQRVRVLADLRREGRAIAASLADPEFVARLTAIAEQDGAAAALRSLGIGDAAAAAGPITPTAARAVAAVALDLTNDLDQMSARITRWMPDQYRRVIQEVTSFTLLGAETQRETQRRAVEAFLGQGVTGFTDKAGKSWKIGTYAEMAVRTQTHRAWIEANTATMSETSGINLVSIVVGVAACEACTKHAGKVWSTDGTPAGTYTLEHATEDRTVSVVVAGTLDDARARGWDHPNCRCTVVAYLPGLSIAADVTTYDPDAERDRDRLRLLERRVREYKRREAAAFDDVTKARMRREQRRVQGQIRDHVKRTGVVRRPDRESLTFSDGKIPATAPRAIAP